MFVTLILICDIQRGMCETMTQRARPNGGAVVHKTYDSCLDSLGKGIMYYETLGQTVLGYECYEWKISNLGEKL
jgi:hypothetical protein